MPGIYGVHGQGVKAIGVDKGSGWDEILSRAIGVSTQAIALQIQGSGAVV